MPQAKSKAKNLVSELLTSRGSHATWKASARLQQVFWNLSEQVSSSHPGKSRISTNSESPVGAPDKIEVRGSNTGIGIESENKSQIFDAF